MTIEEEVIRYNACGYDPSMTPQHGGSWVRWSDYDALSADLTAAKAEIARLTEEINGKTFTVDEGREWKARAEAAERAVAECAEYLKEGETPRQRMDRDHADTLALMDMLAKDRVRREAAERAVAGAREAALRDAAAINTLGMTATQIVRAILALIPTPAAPDPRDAVMAQMADALRRWENVAANCTIEAGICSCGDSMENHGNAMDCGHSPVDMGSAYADDTVKTTAAALAAYDALVKP